jgi:hypothetical protein
LRRFTVGTRPAMCFSPVADLAVGAALLPVAAAALREVKHWREVPFASLPTVFALHQFLEAAIWSTDHGFLPPGAVHLAVLAYLVIALPLLPTLVPIAVLLLEPWGARLRVAPFVVIGAIVSGYLARVVLTQPVGVLAHPHALEYRTEVQNPHVWAVFYVIAVIAPALLSGYPSIVVFGMANLVGLAVVAVVYFQAFASLWCLYAAMTSVLVLVHMIRRRRLPDPHRQDGMSPSVTVPV